MFKNSPDRDWELSFDGKLLCVFNIANLLRPQTPKQAIPLVSLFYELRAVVIAIDESSSIVTIAVLMLEIACTSLGTGENVCDVGIGCLTLLAADRDNKSLFMTWHVATSYCNRIETSKVASYDEAYARFCLAKMGSLPPEDENEQCRLASRELARLGCQ